MAEAQPAAPDGLFRLDGKRVLITGGYGGIGRLTSELMASAGATVAIAGRSEDKAKDAAREIGSGAIGARIDVADRDAAQEGVRSAAEQLGGLDVLVNAAGIERHGPAEEVDPDTWREVIETNLSGAFWLSQAAGMLMMQGEDGGRIVHFSSTRGMVGGRRGFTPYGASKAGVNLLIKQLATEWGQHGINVNGIAPGFVPTPMMEQAAADAPFMQMMRSRIPLGRFSKPIEVASVALFLASPAASFVSGEIIFVDGGVMASS
ncbi:MAG: SDR family NAD(P)-dependent oxidoreductase [Solirubrobacterales bacterium]